MKIAVVSGASHGIGRKIAMTLAERGFAVRGMGPYARDTGRHYGAEVSRMRRSKMTGDQRELGAAR